MIYPLDQIKAQINKLDQQLMYHLVIQQMETNRLLAQLIDGKPVQEAEAVKIDDVKELKRPELMKRIGKTKAPQGWQQWKNEKMIEYLKGVS